MHLTDIYFQSIKVRSKCSKAGSFVIYPYPDPSQGSYFLVLEARPQSKCQETFGYEARYGNVISMKIRIGLCHFPIQ